MNIEENDKKPDKKYRACYEDRKLQQYIKNDNKCIKELNEIRENFVKIKEWIYCISPEKYGSKFIFRKNNISDNSFYLLLELCNYDLKTYLSINETLDFYQYKSIMFQLIYGMSCGSYFLNFSHNDIKTENILIKYVDYNRSYQIDDIYYTISKDLPIIKISDFTFARFNDSSLNDFSNIIQLLNDIYNDKVGPFLSINDYNLSQHNSLINLFEYMIEFITTSSNQSNQQISSFFISCLKNDFFDSITSDIPSSISSTHYFSYND